MSDGVASWGLYLLMDYNSYYLHRGLYSYSLFCLSKIATFLFFITKYIAIFVLYKK